MTVSPGYEYRILIADDEQAILDEFTAVLETDSEPADLPQRAANLKPTLFGEERPDTAWLEERQYALVLCRQGEDAVAAVRAAIEEERPFAAAFIDVRMPPGIDGVQTAERIRALDPFVHIVFVTDYSDKLPHDIARRVLPLDKFLYCQKPVQAFELAQLAHTLTAKWAREQELILLRDRAQAANRAKTDLLTNVSHELRTPLNAIIGFSEVMSGQLLGPMENETYQQYAQDIHDSGLHLRGVIEDILTFAKAEAGTRRLEEDVIEIAAVIEEAVRLVQQPVILSGQTLEIEVPGDLPDLYADGRSLTQTLINLLANAAKFTPEGGVIGVAAGLDESGGLWISVRDTGIGMLVDEVRLALSAFGQVDSGLDRKFEGTGLGLPISAALVEQHGGALDIESVPGTGTTVTIAFPAKRVVSREENAPISMSL